MDGGAARPLRIVFFGLSLSSSWGNGHATTYRALLKGLAARGHVVTFFERSKPWYAENCDLDDPSYCTLGFYDGVDDLIRCKESVSQADAVIVGSFVPDGVAVSRFVQAHARGVTAFYDIDTPVTLAKLNRNDREYLSPEQVAGFDVYYSFTGGPTLDRLQMQYGARAAEPLYCSVDPDLYRPIACPPRWDLGYLGTYSGDRQPTLQELLIEPALARPDLRFVVAGPLYPDSLDWPSNVERIDHVGPHEHPAFYSACRFTLNVTREDMRQAGFSPSVRLFEAAACGAPILSDSWRGLASILQPGRDIAVVNSAADVLAIVSGWPEQRRRDMARAARQVVLANHTGLRRAMEMERSLLRHAAGAVASRPTSALLAQPVSG